MRAMRGFGRWQPLAACLAVGAIAFFGLSLEGARAGKEPASDDRALRTESPAPSVDSLNANAPRTLYAKEASPFSTDDSATSEQGPIGSDSGASVKLRRVLAKDLPIAPPVRVNPFTDEASMMRARGELVGPWRPNTGTIASGGCPGNSCTFDTDCDDCNLCTTDRCVILPAQQLCQGVCSNIAILNGDGAAACSDGVFCNGIETCQGGACQVPGTGSGTATDPNLQIPCTKVCAGGTNNGNRCAVDADCDPAPPGGADAGTCVTSACNEDLNRCDALCTASYCNDISTNKGKVCVNNGDCPGPAGALCVTGAAFCNNGNFCDGTETCGLNGICDSPGDVCGLGGDCSELTCPQTTPKGCFSDIDCSQGTAGSCQDRNRAGCFRGRCCTKGTGCVVNADCDPDGVSGGGEGLLAGGTCTAGQCSNIAAGDQFCASAKFDHCVGPNKSWFALGSGGRPVLGPATCPIIDPVAGLGNVNYQCPKYSSGVAPQPTEYVVNVGDVSNSVCNGFTELGDDYTISNGSHLALETFIFGGGVEDTNVGDRIAFEFYDSAGNFIEDFFFSSGSGVAVRTVIIDPPFVIPPSGRVIARVASAFAPDARIFWAATTGPPFVGSNNVNVSFVNGSSGDFIGECTGGARDGLYCNQANGNADCTGGGICTDRDDVLAFELAGDKVSPPTGACCDVAGVCTQEAKWICSGNPNKTFIDGPCAECSNDSINAGGSCLGDVDCKFCTAGTNAGGACTIPGNCPGSSCVGGPNDGQVCPPALCPGGVCTPGQCLGTCVPRCATGACHSLSGTGIAAPATVCGPGNHWIDGCAGGNDNLPNTVATVGVDLGLDDNADTQLTLLGPTVINRTAPLNASVNFPTFTGPPGHVGADVIDTQITSMNLVGPGGVTLRAGAGGVPALAASRGVIAEKTGMAGQADSFFDVFFELQIAPGVKVYNHTALRVEKVIDRVPPIGGYVFNIASPLALFTLPVGGVEVARLTNGIHSTHKGSEQTVCTPSTTPASCVGVCTASLCVGGIRAGLGCTVNADCGVFAGYGVDCDPNCALQTAYTGGDDCDDTIPNVIDLSVLSTVYVTVSGDNSAATGPDSCTANQFDVNNAALRPYEIDPGWWQQFVITGTTCAYVTLDQCCSDPLHAPQWNVMWDRCPCEGDGFTQWVTSENPNKPELLAVSRGAPFCPPGDDNLWWQLGPLPAGAYFAPMYSSQAGAHGPYQFHITAERCPEAACCYLRCEAAGIPVACTVDADCPGVVGVKKCAEGQCICSLDSECGGGQSCEPACDLKNVLDCDKSRGEYLGLPNKEPAVTFCVAGLCDSGSCCRPGGLCDDALPDLVTPMNKNTCDGITNGKYHGGTLCYGGTCNGGTRNGLSCNDDSICPGGVCVGTAVQLSQRTCPICEIDDDAHCQTGQGDYGFRCDLSVGGDDTFGATTRIADDFIPLELGSINKVCLEGFYRNAGANCGGTVPDKFTVTVYEDNNALPGVLVGTSQTTVFAVGGDGNLFTHQLALTTPIGPIVNDGRIYWLEVSNNTVDINGADDGCDYFWLGAAFGQGNNYAMQDRGGGYGPEDAVAPPSGAPDMHWCINLRSQAPPEPLRPCCSCTNSGLCNSPSGDPCCRDASFFECAIERKSQWIFAGTDCTALGACPQVNAPVHDECTGAITLATGVNTINNDCATDTLDPSLQQLTCQGSPTPFKSDVWYKWINTCPAGVQVDLCDNSNGQDTVMAIYGNHTGTCPCPVATATQINDCSDDDCFWAGSGPSLVIPDVDTNLGDCLMIRMAGFFDDDGGFFFDEKLEISCLGNPVPPAPTKGSDDVCIGGANAGAGCGQGSDCASGVCRNKNRYLTAVIPPSATANGIKVTLVNLHADSVLVPANYNGTDRWAGLPTLAISDGAGYPTFNVAKTQCTFVSTDWSAVGQVHIYGDVIIPGSVYDVFNCDSSTNCSPALRIGTCKFGDVVPPVNTVNFSDAFSVVGTLQGAPTRPQKTRSDLVAAVLNPSNANAVNFSDVGACVSALQLVKFRQIVTAAPATCP